ncbi:hypothetical protein PINS_up012693 [Pythium insidiosum]|nr:hypothetical protein PINS_up012693 [Pythium insidiosum]
MKRRSAVTSRPIEFLPRRFFLVITHETPTFNLSGSRDDDAASASSSPSPAALVLPQIPGLSCLELTRDVLQPAPSEQPLDLRHTLRVCRLLNAQRQAIEAPPTSASSPTSLSPSIASGRPRQLHFFLRSQRRSDEQDAIQLLARWRLLCLQLSPSDAAAPFQHLQALGDGAARRLVASLSGIAKGVAQELLVPPRQFSSLDDAPPSPTAGDRRLPAAALDACFTRVTKRFLVFASPQDPVVALGPTLPEPAPAAVAAAAAAAVALPTSEPSPQTPPLQPSEREVHAPALATEASVTRLSVAQLVPLLKQQRVAMVVRLNAEPRYDDQLIIRSGIEHLDLSTPSDDDAPLDRLAIARFLESCENSQGVVAVHSSTGSGRAALCVACFLVKHARLSAAEATAWLRFCRPGALTAAHERLLSELQPSLWRDGDEYRRLMEESLAFSSSAASTLTVSSSSSSGSSLSNGGSSGGAAEELPVGVRLSSQFSVGRIALGRDSLLGTKDKSAREKEPATSSRLSLQQSTTTAASAGGSTSHKATTAAASSKTTTTTTPLLARASGSFRDIQAAQQLVAADPTLLRQRPLTQGAAGRRRLLDHHHHHHHLYHRSSTSGGSGGGGSSSSVASDGGGLRADFATMHKFVHQAGGAVTSRDSESVALTPRRPVTTASISGSGGGSGGGSSASMSSAL